MFVKTLMPRVGTYTVKNWLNRVVNLNEITNITVQINSLSKFILFSVFILSCVTSNPRLKCVFAAVLFICCSANTCQTSAEGATKITCV